MKALFIHRSVGHNLIVEGGLRKLLDESDVALDDYDNNTGILTGWDGSVSSKMITIADNNTNPSNLAAYFSEWDETLDGYGVVIVKSCYPNSRIKDEAQLEAIKESYQTIFQSFVSHRKQLMLLTSPPLRPICTNQQQAELVDRLNRWLLSNIGEYVHVLDFHGLLSEDKGQQKGMLRREYRRLMPWDNHPNKKANKDIAPRVADFIVAAILMNSLIR